MTETDERTETMRDGAEGENARLARQYFVDGDMNCAEAVLHALNDKYALQLSDDSYQLIASFGGGIGGGHICGAVAGAVAGLGRMLIEERAHRTPDFGARFGGLAERLEARFGSLNCRDIKPPYVAQPERCLPVVIAALDVFDAWWAELQAA